MLLLTGKENGVVQHERVLVTDEGKPTPFLLGLAAAELACDIGLAYLIYRIMRKLRG